jgi:hypothetical protein
MSCRCYPIQQFCALSSDEAVANPNLHAAASYGSFSGTRCWVCACDSCFPCLGRQNKTHQKTEQQGGHWPKVTAVWSKKATINKQLVDRNEGMIEWEHGWGEAYGGVLSLRVGRRIEQRKKIQKMKYVVALYGYVTIFHTQQPAKNMRVQLSRYRRAGESRGEHAGGMTPLFWGAFEVERR